MLSLKLLESTKHYLCNGNVVRAQEKVQYLRCYLNNEAIEGDNGRKMSSNEQSPA